VNRSEFILARKRGQAAGFTLIELRQREAEGRHSSFLKDDKISMNTWPGKCTWQSMIGSARSADSGAVNARICLA